MAPFNKLKYAGDKLVILSDIEREEGIILRCAPTLMFVVADVDNVELGFLIKLEDSSVSASSTTYALATLNSIVPFGLGLMLAVKVLGLKLTSKFT